MRRLPLALVPLCLLAGCAGYAIDYTLPEPAIIQPQLTRYGFDAAQAQCVGTQLGSSLSPWQLRQLATLANTVTQGYAEPDRLTVRDLVHVASQVEDRRVGPAFASAVEACGVNVAAIEVPAPAAPAEIAAPASGAAAADTATAAAAPTPATPPETWLNLGAAGSGQAISVDASTIRRQETTREAWFRLTHPASTVPGATTYLLRLDCTARTISPLAQRTRASADASAEQRDYPPQEQVPLPIEGGTVMEIAYLALCT